MDNLVGIFTKIATKTLRVWLLIVLLGLFLCVVSVITALILLVSDISSGFSGDWHSFTGIMKSILLLFQLAFLDTLLLITSIIVFPVAYFVLANKTASQTAMYEVFKNHLSVWIDSKVNDYLMILQARQPGWLKQVTNGASLQMKLLQVNKEDKMGLKIQQRIVKYFLKRINLGEIDFQNKNLNVGQLVISLLNKSIAELAKPSLSIFWMLVLLQIVLLGLAIWF